MVAVSEAVGTERHALGDPAGLAPEGHEVGRPDEPAHHGVVVLLHVLGEVVRRPASAHQPPAKISGQNILLYIIFCFVFNEDEGFG